jgi:hypothetical protein
VLLNACDVLDVAVLLVLRLQNNGDLHDLFVHWPMI